MSYDVTYSLRKALESSVPEANDVQIIYEGVELTNIPKPYLTIEYITDSVEELSAGHRSYFDTYNFQVGVFANDVNELFRLESKVRKVLREPKGHTLYSYDELTESFVDTGNKIPLYDNGFTPIRNEDNSNITDNHRGYFDVSVEVLT
ncbi:hypothetical protein [Bacillus sp. 7894-2]|uniref:hypothetical protein n=1 Tax=Bacillus sp. 7894-2 TaxID=2021695 RepID=UPI000BA6A6AF|nr:hypothetical protein [Bacillus sp. 7894-2]PAE24077.1 hypothetical protein CHI10_14845 [Bacillus sp. 7894-2]